MKKFSKITNQKVGLEPKVDQKLDEATSIKYRMIDLMDKFLSIQMYGPVDKYQRAGLIKIMGKEILAEAISEMLVDISNKDKTKLLESLKKEINDWEVIDNKIESLEKKTPLLSNRNKISSLLEMYNDEDLLLEVTHNKSSKINNTNTLKDYILLINESSKLNDETKIKMVEIYTQRIKQIESVK